MFTVFDLETTGRNTHKDDIIQFAYITFNNGIAIRSEVLYFYYDDMTWSEEAEAIHHIPREYLKQYKDDFTRNIIRMFTVLSGANVCGFNNIHFDCPFAQDWLARMGLPGLEYRVMQDVMLAFRPITQRRYIKLVELTKLLGVSEDTVRQMAKVWFKDAAGEAAHDASYDTTATAIFTLQGVAQQLISFDDTISVVEKKESAPKVEQSILIATSDQSKQRDPKGMLVYLGETPYILNSNKSVYTTDAPLPYEVSAFTADSRIFKTPFEQMERGLWKATESGIDYELIIGDNSDSLTVVFPNKRIQAF